MAMKKALLLLCALLVVSEGNPSFAQEASADYAAGPVWDDLVQREGAGYRLSAPSAWRYIDGTPYPMVEYFEASGRILPLTHAGAPVIVTIFLTSFPAKSREDGKADVIVGYRQNPDRVFPHGFTHEEEEFSLKGGQTAYLVNTRFYRKSKGLNQSRYDLVAFSEASGRVFMYTLSVQYRDDTYALENSFQLKSIARRLFGYFELK